MFCYWWLALLAGAAGGITYQWVKERIRYRHRYECPHGDLVVSCSNRSALDLIEREHSEMHVR